MNVDIKELLDGRKVDTVVIHCTATKPSQNIGATEVDKMHRARGFLGCGYHYIIRRDGTIESYDQNDRCRALNLAGAHVGDCGAGWNKRSIGVSLVGGVHENEMQGKQPKPENNFTEGQFLSLSYLVAVIDTALGEVEYLGHRDLIKRTHAPPKACPCFDVETFLAAKNTALPAGVTKDFKNTTADPRIALSVDEHTVEAGNTLWGISQLYGVPVKTLMELNSLTSSVLHPGQILVIHRGN